MRTGDDDEMRMVRAAHAAGVREEQERLARRRCDGCRFWNHLNEDRGSCLREMHPGFMISGADEYVGSVTTLAAFGCVQWEARN